MPQLKRLIAVARGDTPADLLFTNARIVQTFTGEVEVGNVAVAEGRIAGVGDYTEAREVIDLDGRYLSPGFIDGHVHVESSYLHIDEYARAVVPHGTLGCITDLHEITNVAGLAGLTYIQTCARAVPFDLFVMAPPCVPATAMETAGATVGPGEIGAALKLSGVLGLGEVMNFPAVINGDDEMLAKIAAAAGRPRDGHAPRVSGRQLNAYLCPIIGSDHETTGLEEGREKLRRGMYLMIREGSTEKNLADLLPLVTDRTYHRCMLVVDDRNAKDLYHDGDVDAVVRKAIRLGLDPVRAITMASLVPATYFRLEGRGGIAPGYWANLLVLGELETIAIEQVYYRGNLVALGGKPLFRVSIPETPAVMDSVRVKPLSVERFRLPARDGRMPVIDVIAGQILTGWAEEEPRVEAGAAVADVERDLLKLVVVERHKLTGNVGVGLVRGFGLKRGALGTSFAHDSHNIVVVGVDDADLLACVEAIIANQGGLAVAVDGEAVATLPLPVAGLLSEEPLEAVAMQLEAMEARAAELGCTIPSPFSVLSFVALPVVPELKLSDMGLVDVVAGKLLSEAGTRS